MKLPLLTNKSTTNVKAFVSYWNRFYNEKYKMCYWEVINKTKWKKADVEKLFKWKNNMGEGDKSKLSPTKKIFVSRVSKKLPWINQHRSDVEIDSFRKEFKKFGPIWAITLLHAMRPTSYPIYDQHVHRAHCFLTHRKLDKAPVYARYKTYVLFFENFIADTPKNKYYLKKVDNALWAFGKFLSSYKRIMES